jgi:hypothetical protein
MMENTGETRNEACAGCVHFALDGNSDQCRDCSRLGLGCVDLFVFDRTAGPAEHTYPYPHVEPCWVCGSVEMEFGVSIDGRRAVCPRCGLRWNGVSDEHAQAYRNRECAEKRGHGMAWLPEHRD